MRADAHAEDGSVMKTTLDLVRAAGVESALYRSPLKRPLPRRERHMDPRADRRIDEDLRKGAVEADPGATRTQTSPSGTPEPSR